MGQQKALKIIEKKWSAVDELISRELPECTLTGL
jgi:hypothetical protein